MSLSDQFQRLGLEADSGEVNFFQAKRRNLADVRSRWSPQIGYICNVASAMISWLKLSTLGRSPRK